MVDFYTTGVQENHQHAIDDARSTGTFNAWIDGSSTAAVSGESFETSDPVVDECIVTVPRCVEEDVNAAVDAARTGFNNTWSDTTPETRSQTLLEWVRVLDNHLAELALLESLDTGKPLEHARGEVTKALSFIKYYATAVRAQEGDQIQAANDARVFTKREPYGVVGCITPWNYPLVLASWKIGPALAAGNCVVLKPAEQSPLTALRIAELSEGVLPDGVFNVVPGFGEEAGAAVTNHPGIRKISFTGEDTTGETVMTAAAQNITPVTLELGGKSPFVVFPDADVEQAAAAVAGSITYNTGQSCDACSRAIVHESVHDEFVDHLVSEVTSLSIGDPLSEETILGPLTSKAQFEKVTSYIDLGKEEGATVATGGTAIEDDERADGWFVEPTVFTDVDNDFRIAREEIFGPVEVVIPFSNYEEGIRLANDTPYGLAAGVATTDGALAQRAAADIDAGSVWINKYYGRTVTGSPFGGYKRSGIGRECGYDTLQSYTQTKTIHVPVDQEPDLRG